MATVFRLFFRGLPCMASGSDVMVPFTCVLSKLSTPRAFATDSKVLDVHVCLFGRPVTWIVRFVQVCLSFECHIVFSELLMSYRFIKFVNMNDLKHWLRCRRCYWLSRSVPTDSAAVHPPPPNLSPPHPFNYNLSGFFFSSRVLNLLPIYLVPFHEVSLSQW